MISKILRRNQMTMASTAKPGSASQTTVLLLFVFVALFQLCQSVSYVGASSRTTTTTTTTTEPAVTNVTEDSNSTLYPSWVINLNDNTFLHTRNGNLKPSYYFPPLEDDDDTGRSSSDSGRSNQSSMVTFYFLLGLFLLFSSMFFCWYFAHHESKEALRRHANRLSRRLSRSRRNRLVGTLNPGDRPAGMTHISVIMPPEDGYHFDPPPMYTEIFASDYEKKNSPFILPSYGEVMSTTPTTSNQCEKPPPTPEPVSTVTVTPSATNNGQNHQNSI